MKNIRVLFLGDEKVGKTSLISTLLSETFPRNVQKTIPPVVIPPDFSIQTSHTSTYLLDTSTSPDDESLTEQELEKADVILLIYDLTNSETIKRLKNYWMPKIHRFNEKVPVILVGNKLDLKVNFGDTRELENVVTPLCMEFNQVEMGIECSAKSYANIIDLIYAAQRAVLYPITPLFDSLTKTLKDDVVRALKRIFRICDQDHDGYLNDIELSMFQMNVFKGELNKNHIEALKEVVLSECPNCSDDDASRGINFEGFVCIHKLMIQKMKLQSCWAILRHFGYDDELKIKDSYFIDDKLKKLDVQDIESVELAGAGEDFLRGLFDTYSRNDLLKDDNFTDIFSTTTKGIPWNIKRTTETNNKNGVSIDHWNALWQMSFRLDYKKSFKTLVYLGYCGSLRDTITLRKTKKEDIIIGNNRNVYHCYILGSPKCGKTTFLDAFIKYPFIEDTAATSSERNVVNFMYDKNQKKYMILTEFPEIEIESLLNNESKLGRSCDLLCLLYEKGDPDSLKYLVEVSQFLPHYIPKILIQTKSDKPDDAGKIEDASKKLGVNQTCIVSCKKSELIQKSFKNMLSICQEPSIGLSVETIEHYKKIRRSEMFKPENIVKGAAYGASIMFLTYLISMRYRVSIISFFRNLFSTR